MFLFSTFQLLESPCQFLGVDLESAAHMAPIRQDSLDEFQDFSFSWCSLQLCAVYEMWNMLRCFLRQSFAQSALRNILLPHPIGWSISVRSIFIAAWMYKFSLLCLCNHFVLVIPTASNNCNNSNGGFLWGRKSELWSYMGCQLRL